MKSAKLLPCTTEEHFVNWLDVFVLSFCAAFIVSSDRVKMLVAGVVRRRR